MIENNVNNLNKFLETQRDAFSINPRPSANMRRNWLKQLSLLLKENREDIVKAISTDFGNRASFETLSAEVMIAQLSIKNSSRKLSRWMMSKRASTPLFMAHITAKETYQPLGVVGIMVPWNYPINLSFVPLIDALSAGNRAMIKMSEASPHLGKLLTNIFPKYLPEDLVKIITGEVEVSASFSKLNFDLLFFTGSTPVGKIVMKSAAENLTPVVLELGGKSPAIVDATFSIKATIERLTWGKTMNAGQTCVAPDYLIVKKESLEPLKKGLVNEYNRRNPSFYKNTDVTGIVNQKQFDRLTSYLKEAEESGASVEYAQPRVDESRKLPLTIVTGNIENLRLMNEEIFGPILPIIVVENMDEAVKFVNNRPRPLALYGFTKDKKFIKQLENKTHSGSLVINDTVLHVGMESIPFGGIGPSGMGQYHGHAGFLTFSKTKPVVKRGMINIPKMAYAPYKTTIHDLFLKMFLK